MQPTQVRGNGVLPGALTESKTTGAIWAGLSVQRDIAFASDRIPEPTMALNRLNINGNSTCVFYACRVSTLCGALLNRSVCVCITITNGLSIIPEPLKVCST